jgi:hypothetical protein
VGGFAWRISWYGRKLSSSGIGNGEVAVKFMRWLGVGAVLVVFVGCSSGTVQGGSGSSGSTTGAGATSTSSGGMSSGGLTSGGTSIGASGGSSTGAHSTTGGLNCLLTTCTLDDGGLACIDIYDDNGNCGGCGLPCSGPGAECSNGACTCTTGSADPILCTNASGSVCTNPPSDPDNCGRCGNVCVAPATQCISGMCQCPGGQIVCSAPDSGVAPFCADTTQDTLNCGTCGNDCVTSFATGSGCRFSECICSPGQAHLCVNLPASSPPTCACAPTSDACATPSFATDVYPLLAQQSGAFGCSASGCHTGSSPAGRLGFLDSAGHLDAGMAYAELVGPDGGDGTVTVPGCDAPVPGAPSFECACLSRVVPGNANASFLFELLEDDPPVQCGSALGMPLDSTGQWDPLGACAQQLLEEWVSAGANP